MRSQLEANSPQFSTIDAENVPATMTNRISAPVLPDSTTYDSGEELVTDVRSEIRPAQMVEDKLMGLLKGDFVMVSQLRMKRMIARRS